jgi:hypothetical protein
MPGDGHALETHVLDDGRGQHAAAHPGPEEHEPRGEALPADAGVVDGGGEHRFPRAHPGGAPGGDRRRDERDARADADRDRAELLQHVEQQPAARHGGRDRGEGRDHRDDRGLTDDEPPDLRGCGADALQHDRAEEQGDEARDWSRCRRPGSRRRAEAPTSRQEPGRQSLPPGNPARVPRRHPAQRNCSHGPTVAARARSIA